MKKEDFNEFLSKAFGKEKDEKTHARVMLLIYFIFIAIVVLFVRLSPSKVSNQSNTNNTNNTNTPDTNVVSPTGTVSPEPTPNNKKTKVASDINYSYSYTINYDGVTEVYLGKRIDDKEKFSYNKNGEVIEYAIKDENYLQLSNGTYHLVDKLDTYFKYCDVAKIFSLIENKVPDPNTGLYIITNQELANVYDEIMPVNNNKENSISVSVNNNNLESIYVNYSNYVSSVLSGEHTLTIRMEFANIGKVEDFEIKMN